MGIDDGDANTASPSASATTEEKEKEKEKEKKKSPADWTKEEIREQAKKAIMGNLTKGKDEDERKPINKQQTKPTQLSLSLSLSLSLTHTHTHTPQREGK